MSYLKTMNTEQLAQNGFEISADDPNLAVSVLYPNLSVRHRCKVCGNWSAAFNQKCPQCFVGKEPLKPTRQYYKLYTGCCNDQNCPVRLEALAFLRAARIDAAWPGHDGFGTYVNLDAVRSWTDSERSEFFATINEFSVSKFGARLLSHPNSKRRSKLPKRPR